ncbi:MAG: T9SS type A sorting domain-containing protein, partial [Melioribacteraceae bacterium]|nr:T9SS type A sorting domain-containing protein [Melioribacteraceae bacterium]
FNTTNGDTTITVFNDVQDQIFDLILNIKPNSLTFDPNNWILKDINGITNVDDKDGMPFDYELSQNYPNPFNPSTNIIYTLQNKEHILLKVYDALGVEVKTLINNVEQAGTHKVEFNASLLPSGVYYYQLSTRRSMLTRKMLYLK